MQQNSSSSRTAAEANCSHHTSPTSTRSRGESAASASSRGAGARQSTACTVQHHIVRTLWQIHLHQHNGHTHTSSANCANLLLCTIPAHSENANIATSSLCNVLSSSSVSACCALLQQQLQLLPVQDLFALMRTSPYARDNGTSFCSISQNSRNARVFVFRAPWALQL